MPVTSPIVARGESADAVDVRSIGDHERASRSDHPPALGSAGRFCRHRGVRRVPVRFPRTRNGIGPQRHRSRGRARPIVVARRGPRSAPTHSRGDRAGGGPGGARRGAAAPAAPGAARGRERLLRRRGATGAIRVPGPQIAGDFAIHAEWMDREMLAAISRGDR